MGTPTSPEERQRQTPPPRRVAWPVLFGSLLKSLVIVTATYTLTAAGMYFGLGDPDNLPKVLLEISEEVESLGMILLFTASHAMMPVLIYAAFWQQIRDLGDIGGCYFGCFLAFIYLHMGFWFGVPIILLAIISGWLSLIWAVLHIALARPGHRISTFIEYGSTSFALLFFLGAYAEESFFPYGLLIVVAQAAMLTVVDWVGERFLVPSTDRNSLHTDQA